MLILAGITLSIVLSDGGLIDKTKEAIGEHEKAQEKEQEELGEAAGMMKNLIEGLGSTGGTTPVTPPTPPSGGTGSSEVAGDLKEYQGKYVDIGLDVDGDGNTTNDWELFYATSDRIFLISADFVSTTKLEAWNVIGDGRKLDGVGFKEATSHPPYCLNWPNHPTSFLSLPTEPDNFLELVMHTQYDLEKNKNNYNSMETSQLLNTESWNGIKEAAKEKDNIDFVIGGPTLEMWCAAWSKAIESDSYFRAFEAYPSGCGYRIRSGSSSGTRLYVSASGSKPSTDQLEKYKTFFSHTSDLSGCTSYWLASPSSEQNWYPTVIHCDGLITVGNDYDVGDGVRPLVCLQSGVKIIETTEDPNKYNISK